MCTIESIPELLRAGIDSFKIEGRMKKAEYAAGVTAIYRKYIDRYYKNPDETLKISKEDMHALSCLYIRSERQDGYYHKHNGKEMVTLNSPAYSGSDERLLEHIRKEHLAKRKTLPVRMTGPVYYRGRGESDHILRRYPHHIRRQSCAGSFQTTDFGRKCYKTVKQVRRQLFLCGWKYRSRTEWECILSVKGYQ